jgi:adenylate kinase
LLAERLGVPVISTGALLRTATDRVAVTGDVADRLARGELVSDDIVLELLADALTREGAKGGYVLDGFPRTVIQAERTDAPPLDAVVHLALPDDVARQRLTRRGAVRRARPDDLDREAIERRLRHYHADTPPLLDHSRARGLLSTVDATDPPKTVAAAIRRAVGIPDVAT